MFSNLFRCACAGLFVLSLSGLGCQKPDVPVAAEPSDTAVADDATSDKSFGFDSLQGSWAVVALDGSLGQTVAIPADKRCQLPFRGAMTANVVFDPDADSPPGVVYLSYESPEDEPAMGGAGPRKGIVRQADNGDLEVFVAAGARLDYPAADTQDTPLLTLRSVK
ncbi:MAG: hypothetical protein AAF958_20280 [Planctomycetota bacterium]